MNIERTSVKIQSKYNATNSPASRHIQYVTLLAKNCGYMVMNTHATIKELLDASFSMRSVSYQGK
jgi:hypothetical protein